MDKIVKKFQILIFFLNHQVRKTGFKVQKPVYIYTIKNIHTRMLHKHELTNIANYSINNKSPKG